SHALHFGMFHPIALNLRVSGLECRDEGMLWVFAKLAVIEVAHGFHCEPASLLAAFVSAHAVSDYRQTSLALKLGFRVGLPIKKRVLIVLAQATHVGQSSELNPGFGFAEIHCHKRNRRSKSYPPGRGNPVPSHGSIPAGPKPI